MKISGTKRKSKIQIGTRFSRRLITGLLIIAFGSYIATSPIFIKPLYQSETLIFVPLIILSKQIEQQGIGFASDREIDAHIQILESGQLKDSLIERFNLDETYGIDPAVLGGRNRLHKQLASRIKIQKTRFSSLSIQVKDTDPARATAIANDIVDLGNVIKEAVLYANRKGAVEYAKNLYESKLHEIELLENEIDSLTSAARNSASTEQAELAKLQTQYGIGLQELMGRKNHFEREQKSLETELPQAYVISAAIADTSPNSPNRKLISLSCILLYFFAAGVFFIVSRDVKLVYKKD